jgi:PAS domain S-box-containing protein
MKPVHPSCRILLVAAGAPFAARLQARIEKLGHEVVGVAVRGEAAVEAVAGAQADVVVLDARLPGELDGVEVAQRLRERGDLPVILYAADLAPALIERAMAADPVAVLALPLRPEELGAAIQIARHRREQNASARGTREQLEAEVARRTEKLDASERRLRDFLDNCADLIQVVDTRGRILFANQAWHRVLGYTETASAELNIFDVIAPDCRDHCATAFRRLLEDGRESVIATVFVARDGRRIDVEGNVSVRFEDGVAVNTRGIFRDVTARKQAEAQLRENEDNLAITLRSIGDAVLVIDRDRRVTRLNAVAERLTGWTEPEAQGRLVDEIVVLLDEATRHPRSLAPDLATAAGEARPAPHHSLLRCRDGREIEVDDRASPLRDAAGCVRGVVLVFRDMSEARRAQRLEREQQQETARFQSALLALRDYDTLSREDFIRSATARIAVALPASRVGVWLLDRSRENLVGADQFEAAPGTHAAGGRLAAGEFPAFWRAVARDEPILATDAASHPATRELAARHLTSQGIVSLLAVPIRVGGEWAGVLQCEHAGAARVWRSEEARFAAAAAGCLALALEYAERKRVEAQLAVEVARLAGFIQGSNIGTWEWNVVTGETVFNERWADVVGYTLAELAPVSIQTWLRLVHPDDAVASGRLLERHFAGELPYYDCECRMRHRAGHWVWIHDRGRVISRMNDGRPLMMYGTHADITARKATEFELGRTRRRLEMALRASRTATWDSDVAGNRIVLDPAWAALLGEPDGETVTTAKSLLARTHPADRDAIMEMLQRSIIGGQDEYTTEHRVRSAAGRWIWILTQGRVVARDERGRATRIIGTNTDITARRLAEDAVRRQGEIQRMVAETAAAFLSAADEDEAGAAIAFALRRSGGLLDADRALLYLLAGDGSRMGLVQAWTASGQPVPGQEAAQVPVIAGWWGDPLAQHGIVRVPAAAERDVSALTGGRAVAALVAVALTEQSRSFGLIVYEATRARLEWAEVDAGNLRLLADIIAGGIARRKAETALIESAARLTEAQRIAHLGSWHLDLATNRVSWTEELFRVFDLEPAESPPPFTAHGRLFTPASWATLSAAIRATREEGVSYELELETLRRDGRAGWMWVRGEAVKSPAGAIVAIRGVAQDITVRKRAEEEVRRLNENLEALVVQRTIELGVSNTSLRKTEQRFRAVFEHSPVIIGVFAVPDTRVLALNRAAAAAFGYSEEEAVGRTTMELDLWPDPVVRDRCLRELRETGQVQGIETTMRRRNGETFPVVYNATIIEVDGEKVSLHSLLDVSAQRETEARFRSVFDASPIPILLWRLPDERIREMNAAGLDAFGHTRDGAIGATIGELGLWLDPAQGAEFLRQIGANGSIRAFEARMRTRAGETRIMLCNGTLVAAGPQRYVLLVALDVTAVRQAEAEKARMQARVFQNQKYEALGSLAGGVAHDFNNILTGIINYAVIAREECLPTQAHVQGYLDEVLACSSRAKELVRQILLFSRSEDGKQEPVLLQQLIKEALKLLRPTLPTSIKIETHIEASASAVMANATQMHQVMMNLVINAAHALGGEPGRITIRLDARELDAAAAASLPELAPGPHVRLEVTDTGCGMDESVMARMFEPFFTTKRVGEGTGLGLAVVHGIIRAHRGAIKVQSQVGAGTTFEIFLPATGQAAARGVSRRNFRRGHGEHVLLVDDEEAVGRSTEIFLGRIGYRVTFLTSPEAALARFEANLAEFDAVITDHQMPGMTGLVLARRMLARRPDLPVTITSGFIGGVGVDPKGDVAIHLLNKPIEFEVMATHLSRILRGKAKP